VNPGFGGQSFIRNVLPKIRALREIVMRRALPVDIEIDGGVNSATVSEAAEAGANVLVAGSAVFGAKSYRDAIAAIRAGATDGLAKWSSPVGA
jgi:ribulose-phosphate 3-epimerase